VSYALLKHRESGHNNTATHDYIATDDPYLALDPRELQQYWSEPHENYRAELDSLQFLLAHLGHVTVHVVLLGNYPPSLAPHIHQLLERTVHLPYMATITPANTTLYASHRRFHYHVTLRDSSSELFRALQHLHDTRNHVQQSEVDAVLSSQSRDAHASTVYLFMNEAHQSQRNYVLSAQSTNQRCGGIVWTKERDLFVDLRALSRASSGPRHAGEGVHEQMDLPNLDTTALARVISSLVTRLIDQVIVPRVYFKPLLADLRREIQVVVLHLTQSRDDANSLKFDTAALTSVLTHADLPKFGNRAVEVTVVKRNLDECEICRRLHRSALKSRVASYLDSSAAVQVSTARQYFDSHVIREFVQRHWTTLSGTQSRDRHVVPVVVLETDDHVLLAPSDHVTRSSPWAHQYPNMVIAVQPRDLNTQHVTGHTCDTADVVQSAAESSTRAAIAACLQLLWGLVPSHVVLQLSPAHQDAARAFQSHLHEILHADTRSHVTSGASHTVTHVTPQLSHDWLVARVPSIFSPYSAHTALTQLQIDAAHVNHVIHLTDHVLEQIGATGQHLTLLTGVINVQLTQRINLMLYKLKLAFKFSEQLKFQELAVVLQSILGHDLHAIHEILHDHVPYAATLTLDRCAAPPALPGGISVSSAILGASFLFWLIGAAKVSRELFIRH
jgi:hypothetical protein